MANAREAALKMIGELIPGATICPSQIARAIASQNGWREEMRAVHSAVDNLLSEGIVSLSWKGQRLHKRNGPYRISSNS